MSSLDSEREFVAEISEKSTVSELIGLLISSFQRKEFKLVEKRLVEREEELKAQLKQEQDRVRLLEKLHGEAELRISEVQDDLNRLKNENVELREEKLENAQKLLRYEQRVTNLEEIVANVLNMDVSEIRTLAVTRDQEASRSINRMCDRPRSPSVVEIIQSDDDSLGDEKPHVSKACSSKVHLSKKGETFMSNDDPIQDNIGDNSLDSLPSKRKRSLTETDDSQMVKKKCLGLQTPSRKLAFHSSDDSSDYSSSDSEDECSESSIKKMIESLRKDCRKSLKIWNSANEMMLDFLNSNELCMNAVCALYRKGILKKSSVINLDSFSEMSDKDLAEYLIDGDPQHRLKRTVSEVQEKDSIILDRCKELAYKYKEALFEIYHKNEDPLFPSRS